MKKKKYMTVTEAVQYLLGKEEKIDAGTIESITYENGNLTFTFKDGSTQTVNVGSGDTSELEQAIESLQQDLGETEDDITDVKADIEELRTNKQDKLVAGSGITINPNTNEISSDGATYTAGANINIDSNNKISCTVDTSNFVEKLVPTGTSDIYDQYRTNIERVLYDYSGHQNAKAIRNRAYQREYLQGQTKYSETYLGTEDGNDYEFKELIFNKSGTPSYSDATNVAYRILKPTSLTESINNKYKKVYNTSNGSYSETIKYSQTEEGNEMVYSLVREPFKFIASDIELSADVTVDAGIYEVITATVTMNNTLAIKDTIYKPTIRTDVIQYECIEIIPSNAKNVISTYNRGTTIHEHIYNTSTTPETLVDSRIYTMTQQP